MFSPFVKQLFAVTGCICGFFVLGYLVGLQSTYLPKLKEEGSELKLTDDEVSWILSAVILGQMPIQVAGGMVADKLGRKIVIILAMISGLISCIAIYMAQNFLTLLIGFGISGWTMLAVLFGPIIVAESVSPKYRGAMLTIKNAFSSLGFGCAHYFGPIYYWRTLVLCGLIPCMIGLISTLVTPESPAWLAKRGRFEEAKKSFKWFRGDNDLQELNQLIKSQEIVNAEQTSDKSKIAQFSKFMTDRSFLKSAAICIVICFYMEATGKRLFVTFSFDIINSIFPGVSANYFSLFSVTYDFVDMISFIVAGLYIHRLGRKPLILFTAVPSIILVVMFFVVHYLHTNGYLSGSYAWLSMVLFLLNFVPLSLGVIPAVTALMGEIIPLSHRGVGLAILSSSFNVIYFAVTKYTFSLLRIIGVHGIYLVYAGLSALCLVFTLWLTPETNLKTLVEVEYEMRGDPQLGFENEMRELVPKSQKDLGELQSTTRSSSSSAISLSFLSESLSPSQQIVNPDQNK